MDFNETDLYLVKRAVGWKHVGIGVAAAAVAAPLLYHLLKEHVGKGKDKDLDILGDTGVGASIGPEVELSPLEEQIARISIQRRHLSNLLQATHGAYGPASNPWGKEGEQRKEAAWAAPILMGLGLAGSLLPSIYDWWKNRGTAQQPARPARTVSSYFRGNTQPQQALLPHQQAIVDTGKRNWASSYDAQALGAALGPSPSPMSR